MYSLLVLWVSLGSLLYCGVVCALARSLSLPLPVSLSPRMLRRSAPSLGLFSALREELGKVPAFLSYTIRKAAEKHVDSVSQTVDFLKGNSPTDTPEMREKRQRHKEMYNALMAEQQAQKKEANAKRKAHLAAMSWSERVRSLAAEAKEALQQMTSTKAGTMALLQHCTASHAAEVAVEQGIDVKSVQMVLEKQQKPNSVESEEVVVGYIDAPTASEEELSVYAERLQKACAVANTMHIQWKRAPSHDPQDLSHTEKAGGNLEEDDTRLYPSSFSFAASEGVQPRQPSADDSSSSSFAPAGMPGARRYAPRGVSEDEEALHLPGVKRNKGASAKGRGDVDAPHSVPRSPRLRTATASEKEKEAAAVSGEPRSAPEASEDGGVSAPRKE